MSQPFVGELRLFGFDRAPRGWALCQGQSLPIAQNQALFSLLGTNYGGNGVTTFNLPDLRGRGAVGGVNGTGLGASAGVETVTLTQPQLPAHTHSFVVNTATGDQPQPGGAFLAGATTGTGATPIPTYAPAGGAVVPLAANSLASVGSNQPHNNIQPSLVENYSIALQGIFPSRN